MFILVPSEAHCPVSLLGTMPNENIRRLLVSPLHVYCHKVISLTTSIRSLPVVLSFYYDQIPFV